MVVSPVVDLAVGSEVAADSAADLVAVDLGVALRVREAKWEEWEWKWKWGWEAGTEAEQVLPHR
jgi:hypothetical protein